MPLPPEFGNFDPNNGASRLVLAIFSTLHENVGTWSEQFKQIGSNNPFKDVSSAIATYGLLVLKQSVPEATLEDFLELISEQWTALENLSSALDSARPN